MPTLLQVAALKVRDEFIVSGTNRANVPPHTWLCALMTIMEVKGLLTVPERVAVDEAIDKELESLHFTKPSGFTTRPVFLTTRPVFLTEGWKAAGKYGLGRIDGDEATDRRNARLQWLAELVTGERTY